MGKFFKFILLAAGFIAALVIVLAVGAWIYISINYPPAKLKAIATQKLSETLKHKVSIGDVRFNILNGFEITDLHIGNRAGWTAQDMVVAKDISISYDLFPLLWGKISLGEIKLNAPQILIERRGLNEFNFSDMTGSAAAAWMPRPGGSFDLVAPAEAATAPAATAPASKTMLLLSVKDVRIIRGKMTYVDETAKPVQRYDTDNLNFTVSNISLLGGKSNFSLDTPFSYNNLTYQLSLKGSYRYFYTSQSLKELSVDGTVNDLGFGFSGDVLNMNTTCDLNIDGQASLDMLKFSGLVPGSLASMPKGLSLSGPADVKFHLSGSPKSGIELKGTADASSLAIQYQDVFVKSPKAACKVDFDAINSGNAYNVKNFRVVYRDWTVDGSFLYKNGVSYSGEVHSKDLPLSGLTNDIPRLKNDKIDGTVAMDLTYSQLLNKPSSLKANGQIVLKNIGFSLPNEPYLQNLNSVITVAYPNFKTINATFNGFDGSGVASLSINAGKTLSYAYAFDLKSVNVQKLIDSSVDAYVVKNPEKYKDKLFGSANMNYKGTGHGTSSEEMMASANGSGNYSIANGKVKGYDAISYLNKFFGQQSDEIDFETISGTLAMKNKIASYTVNTTGKVGAVKAVGAINVVTYFYAPEMNVNCDIHKEFLNSDAIKSQLPDSVRDKYDVNRLADSNGNVPLDFHFTGDATKVPGADCLNVNRLVNNLLNSYAGEVTQQVQQQGQNILKGLFGK